MGGAGQSAQVEPSMTPRAGVSQAELGIAASEDSDPQMCVEVSVGPASFSEQFVVEEKERLQSDSAPNSPELHQQMTASPQTSDGADSRAWYDYWIGQGDDGEDGDEEEAVQAPLDDVVGDMPWVTQEARQAVARAVLRPPRYASMRLRKALTKSELLVAPFKHPPGPEVMGPASEVNAPAVSMPVGAPEGPIRIQQLYEDGLYDGIIVPWLARASAAMKDLAEGRVPARLESITITQDRMPEWARGIVWDTVDPRDCRPVQRSTERTLGQDFPGDRLNARAIRREAKRLGWPDEDIVDQIAGGGFEGRFDCPLDTVLAFHHQGVVKPPKGMEHCEARSAGAGFKQVDDVVRQDVEREWTAPAVQGLAYVPSRVVPRNVVMNLKFKVGADGVMNRVWKPRVTTDDSFPHDGTSMNDGTAAEETATKLPTPQHLAWALAVILGATDAARIGVVLWGLDFSDAYRYCPVQKADQWANCFVWTDGVHVERRGVFGAAWMPNRFQRLANLARAAAAADIADFDRAVPPVAGVRRWSEARRQAGLVGDDLLARFVQIYIDDSLGVGTDDLVELPPEWEHLHPRESHTAAVKASTEAMGGTPAHPYARGAVHARIAAKAYARLGFVISIPKSQAGSKIGSLGLRANADDRCLDCIPHRAAALRAEAKELQAEVQPGNVVDGRRLERLVGRINYVAQVAPELKPYLRYGYSAVKGVRSKGRGVAKRPRRGAWAGDISAMKVAKRFDAAHAKNSTWKGVRQLLQLVASTVHKVKVPLAPSDRFVSPLEGAGLVHVDASRNDGMGGWWWHRDRTAPGGKVLYVFATPWPAAVKQQLSQGDDRLSMPAGELAATMVAKTMVEDVSGASAVIVVTDCAPVEGAVNAMVSPSPQLHELLRATYATRPATQLMSVHVKREFNEVADELSKGGVEGVLKQAADEGYTSRRWPIRRDHPVWRALERAALLPQHA